MAYKLQSKFKKYYYDFFIKLENFEKNAEKEAEKKVKEIEKDEKRVQATNIGNAVYKLNQVNSILFSKYFEHAAKQNVFTVLKYLRHYQEGLKKISILFGGIKKE